MTDDPRTEAAQQRFSATPQASAFERTFAQRFYAHVAAGGSMDIEEFPAVLLRRRTRQIGLAAVGIVTALSIVILPSMATTGEPASLVTNLVSSWIAAALIGAVPALIAVILGRRRLQRDVAQMQRDRAMYIDDLHKKAATIAETDQRLIQLGIDL